MIALLVVSALHGQVFSPGPLSQAHRDLEGLSRCVECHSSAGRADAVRCQKCHEPIAVRVVARRGLHGQAPQQECGACHREHRGVGTPLAPLTDGGGPERLFDHSRSGFVLVGQHQRVDCRTCHEQRRVVDVDARALLKDKHTWLGLSARCSDCHFDEHRGQLGVECKSCHTPHRFAPGDGFNHDTMSSYPLVGGHKKAACTGCHSTTEDSHTDVNAFPAPRTLERFTQYTGTDASRCIDCHQDDDAHQGKAGPSCQDCHTPIAWTTTTAPSSRAFHNGTDFPLKGAHERVACSKCHGPFPKTKTSKALPARYQGLPHARCNDCHADSHGDQRTALATARGAEVDVEFRCERCHDERAFLPARFTHEDHTRSAFPIVGAHNAVSCRRCHGTQPAPPRMSSFRMARDDVAQAQGDCRACHKDEHRNQFTARCDSCHTVGASFKATIFNHDDSTFPLTGAHHTTPCALCHSTRDDGAVAYRDVKQNCADCHSDAHDQQLMRDGVTDCTRCHTTVSFTPASRFDHDDSRFALRGKHQDADCVKCHQKTTSAAVTAQLFTPVPRSCAECHVDEHNGAFDVFAPVAVPVAVAERCTACHDERGFIPARFAHERTGFVLNGRHQGASCASCHARGYEERAPTTCASCHRDPHGRQFGQQCQGCHDERSFAPLFGVDAHRMTAFPLVGRHGLMLCTQCHGEQRAQTFSRAPMSCVDCHRADALSAGARTIDHSQDTDCKRCHTPISYSPARLAAHEPCFPIARGPHASVRCAQCHAGSLAGARVAGACDRHPVGCASCHAHNETVSARQHQNVTGYAHDSARCLACHRPL